MTSSSAPPRNVSVPEVKKRKRESIIDEAKLQIKDAPPERSQAKSIRKEIAVEGDVVSIKLSQRGQPEDGFGNGSKEITQALPSKTRQRYVPTSEDVVDNTEPPPTGPMKNQPRISTLQPGLLPTGNGYDVQPAVLEITKPVRRGRSSDTQEELQAIYEAAIRPQYGGKKNSNSNPSDRSQMIAPDTEVADAVPSQSKNSGKRGRSSRTEMEVQAIHEEATNPLYKSKTAGQTKTNVSSTGQEPVSLSIISKRDGKNKSGQSKSRVEKPQLSSQMSSQRRGRSSLNEAEVAAIYEEAVWGKHRGREVEEPVEPVTTTSRNQSTKQYARGRRSGTVLEVETATSSLAKEGKKVHKKRDQQYPNDGSETGAIGATKRPSKSKNHHQPLPNLHHQVAIKPTAAISKGKRARQSPKNEVKAKKSRGGETVVQDTRPGKPNRQDSEGEGSEREETPPYQCLTAVTRQIPRHTINSKWEPLPPGGVEHVSQLLHDIQRPAVIHLNDERRRTQASTALQMVSRRLIKKISKIPFPQGTRSHREDDLNFEKILDYNRTLESVLTPVLHANELLEAEMIKETALLQAEQSALEELTTNAKSEASLRNEAGRKLHSLLLSDGPSVEKEELEDIGLLDELGTIPTALHVSISNSYTGKKSNVSRCMTIRIYKLS